MRLAPTLASPEPKTGLAGRLLAATLGSYLLCFALLAALHILLPATPKATLSLLPFLICAATVFWAFQARDIWQTWMVMLVPAALCGAVVLLRS